MNIFHFFQLFKTAFLNIDPAGIYKNNNKWGSLILNIASCTDSNCGLIRSPTESTAFQISKLVKEGGNDINIIESQSPIVELLWVNWHMSVFLLEPKNEMHVAILPINAFGDNVFRASYHIERNLQDFGYALWVLFCLGRKLKSMYGTLNINL